MNMNMNANPQPQIPFLGQINNADSIQDLLDIVENLFDAGYLRDDDLAEEFGRPDERPAYQEVRNTIGEMEEDELEEAKQYLRNLFPHANPQQGNNPMNQNNIGGGRRGRKGKSRKSKGRKTRKQRKGKKTRKVHKKGRK